MKKVFTCVAAALLAAVMVLGLAGCGKSKSTTEINKETIYKEEVMDLPFPENSYLSSLSVYGDKIYFSGYSYNQVTYNSEYYLGSVNTDGTDFKTTKLKQEEGHSRYVDTVIATKDGGVIVGSSEYYEDNSDPDNYVWESYYYLEKLDANGNTVFKYDLSKDLNINYIENIVALDDGNILIYANGSFFKLDQNGKVAAKREVSGNTYINSLFKLKDGSACVSFWSEDGKDAVKKLDMNTLEPGEEITFPFAVSNYSIQSGNRQYDILVRGSGSIYGFNIGDSELTEIVNMINSDINTTYFTVFELLDDNSYLGYYTEWTDDSTNNVVARYTKVNPEDYVEKTILTLGCVYLDSDIRTEVIKFNKKNDKYRIVIKDYSLYNTDDDYSSGYNKLNSDIASGQSPDIIIMSDSSKVKEYASKGLFVDLHKFLDSDKEVNSGDIWPNLIEVSEIDGKLVQLVPTFNIQTLAGKKSLLGDRTGWTVEEMLAYEQTLPEGTSLFESTLARENFISMMLSVQANDFIDYTKATCDFDSEEFKSILRYAAKLPTSDSISYDDDYYADYNSIWRENRAALYAWYLSEPSNYQELIKGYMGEDVTIVGYPTKDGSNGSVVSFYSSFLISSKSKNQEGAWDFIKTFWGEDFQKAHSWGITASKSLFEEKCKEMMKRPTYTDYETGETVEYDYTWWTGGEELVMDPLTQAEVDTLMNYVGSVSKVFGSVDDDVLTIINDEAASFFSGQKSVDDVTTIIQNRISTYLKEKQ